MIVLVVISLSALFLYIFYHVAESIRYIRGVADALQEAKHREIIKEIRRIDQQDPKYIQTIFTGKPRLKPHTPCGVPVANLCDSCGKAVASTKVPEDELIVIEEPLFYCPVSKPCETGGISLAKVDRRCQNCKDNGEAESECRPQKTEAKCKCDSHSSASARNGDQSGRR